nr:hypothetical protein [[Eubacterium] tenue]
MKPKIEDYLKIVCQLIIDEFNEEYSQVDSNEELRKIANEQFSQADMCNRIGNTFKSKVHYKDNNIIVTNNDFNISIHYLKSYKSDKGNPSNRKPWKEHKSQFNWIEDEIVFGNKGKNAYILCWFNCIDTFCQVMQLGQSTGINPYINDNRFLYFPFLKKTNIPAKTLDIEYNYSESYEKLKVNIIGCNKDIDYRCMFIGTKEDKLHFAIYY